MPTESTILSSTRVSFVDLDGEIGKSDGKAYLKRVANRQSKNQRKEERVLASCRLCLANGHLKEEEILSISDNFYLLQPNQSILSSNEAPFPGKHFMLVPFSHSNSIRSISEQEREELKNYRRSLEAFAKAENLSVLYMETALNFDKVPHAKLEVILAEESQLEQVSIFFSKAFTELDGDWSTHKKVIELTKKNGGLFKQIPSSMLA